MLALVAPISARAQIVVRHVALYPLQVSGASVKEVAELRSLLEDGLAGAAHRGTIVAARLPPSAKACGASPREECLSKLAGNGLVVFGTALLSDSVAQLQLSAVDAKGQVAGPVRFSMDTFFQSTDSAIEAIEKLTAQLSRTVAVTFDARVAAPAETPQAAISPSATSWREKPALAESAPEVDSAYPSKPSAPSSWMRTGGPIAAATGAVLLVGAIIAGFVDRGIATSLDQKYRTESLAPSDRPSYDRVRTLNTVANTCFLAGGVISAVGIGVWIAAPAPGPRRSEARIQAALHF